MQAYLDNSATTKPYKEVVNVIGQVMLEQYGNPSSMHMLGVEAEKRLSAATKIIADTLKCKPAEILYTSGGTESDNMALIGIARIKHRLGKHIITTAIEHPAILETCVYLEKEGFEISYLDTDENGVIKLDQLESLVRKGTILVSIMHTNNEIGSIQPIAEASKLVKSINPDCLIHVDAVQGYGKAHIIPKKMGIDLMSVSAHKLHGPRGVGFLYVKEGVRISPIIWGGGQQKGLRSGTENVAGICAMAEAARITYANLEDDVNRLYELKEYFISELLSLEGITVNGIEGTDTESIRATAPHIVSASFDGVRSEVLLHSLEDKEIYVSAGSACASNKPHISSTLVAIGVPREHLDSTIRFSFSVDTTREELDYTIETLKQLLPLLRKYTRH